MNPSQANSREYQWKAIDAEIKSLEDSIRALRLRRNALAPVSSLPPEIIAAIFSILRLPPGGTTPLGGRPDRHLSWLRVAHVCHRWREVALNQPFFWSHVDFSTLSSAGMTEILVRAKSVPLYLEARVPKYRWDDDNRFSIFQKEIQARVSHICHLSINAGPLPLDRVLKKLVSPAPTLEYLSLSCKKYRDRMTWEQCSFIPDTLFDGSTPRLSWLELSGCDFSWKSPLLRGLKHLKIRTPSADAIPSLSVWLDALDELPQLKTLGLHSASPIAPPFPFDVERTVTLFSLTHFDITASPGGCAFALAHLVLPALASLWVTAMSHIRDREDVQNMLPYVVQHAHGPQDARPLQSVLIHGYRSRADIFAWPVPDVGAEVDNPPTLLAATLSPRVALSVTNKGWSGYDNYLEILDAGMAAFPLDGLVTLTTQLVYGDIYPRPLEDEQFWLRHASKWPLLQCVQLTRPTEPGFIGMLLEDNGGRESPLLPSLTELVLVDFPLRRLHEPWILRLCDTLMKRVEQGVPLEMLDLRWCLPHPRYDPDPAAVVQPLSEIAVNVLVPEKTFQSRGQMDSLWVRSLENDNSGAEDGSDTNSDD
ncbi:hypothetical protein BJY52DRAFT_1166858 [Lactarius psammicola]|nr:hypothetical protein BJY52DRAFT_1166858 [Lactarius psammicola]